jgi:hypothetical protein
VVLVITQDSTGLNAGAESAARVTEDMGLTWTVLGDHEGTWVATWGSSDDGLPQHSYTLLDESGRLLWRRADGSKTSVDEVAALTESELR